MADPFVAEIRIFPFNFAPKGWAWCDGQLLPLSQNTALFSLLGTTYGGDGKSNFALPDLQGSAPMHPGQGPGLSLHDLGETGGSETVTLLESEIPSHGHAVHASAPDATTRIVAGQLPATGIGVGLYGPQPGNVTLAPNAMTPAGGDQPHNNMQPYLTFYFNIALQGVFPAALMDGMGTVALTLRSSTEDDREHLLAVYSSTRAEELDQVEWAPGAREAFLKMQFDAQDHEYRRANPQGTFDVIEVDGRPAGRLYVDRRPGDLRIVDIALLPELCGRGIGRRLLTDLQAQAAAEGRIVSIHVEVHNRAAELYERLGFVVAADLGVYRRMEWAAP